VVGDHQDEQLGSGLDELDAEDVLLGRAGGDGQAGVLGQPAQELGGASEDLFQVTDGSFEVRGDGAALRVPELAPGRKRVDEPAVTEVGGDAAGRGVRVGEIPHLLERGQVVADGRAGDAEAVALGDGLAPDRLTGSDVLLHDCPEDS
jgi:hypothetical protein